MEFLGHLVKVTRDFTTGKFQITFELDEGTIKDLDKLFDCKLVINAKKHRDKRSLDSNGYAWKLMQLIAEAIHSDKWSVYLDMLQKYSRAFTHIFCETQAIPRLSEMYRTYIDLGEVTMNGFNGHQLQVYFGSSTFDTKEMSVFIDGLVSECRELDIPLIPDSEIERIKAEWGK